MLNVAGGGETCGPDLQNAEVLNGRGMVRSGESAYIGNDEGEEEGKVPNRDDDPALLFCCQDWLLIRD